MINKYLGVNKQKLGFVFMLLFLVLMILPAQTQFGQLNMNSYPENTLLLSSISSTTSTSTSILSTTRTSSLQESTSEWLASSEVKADTPVKQTKTVYLTFDDGPSKLTGKVLDILQDSNVKATFFVLGEHVTRYPELISRLHEEGHAIGNHTYNHNYDELYKGFSPFWDQIKQTEAEIQRIIGVPTSLVRAPGGTAGHFDNTYFSLMKQAGYHVIDWNVDSGDSKRKNVPAQDIIRQATENITGDQVIVLMHDGGGHEETIKALPSIISKYRAQGYNFDILTPEQQPIQFKVTQSAKSLKRVQPSQEWIATHIVPNAGIFTQSKDLILQVGGMETKFQSSEYQIVDGKIMVPVRATMERLGGRVKWDQQHKLAVIEMNSVLVQIDMITGNWINTRMGKQEQSKIITVTMKAGVMWAPIRELLQFTGHPTQSIHTNDTERMIKTY
ncbi:peptidoglycan/xylan/chitin deacetylase (PgdA/CDA1 family) [Paenibacillus sp. DS2015]|uniref:polysaccharide deacetylase n=1 Tax=Paenibacillus sp. DS2015 TaxID=3373917 RepID=UPI003D1DB551